MTPSVPIALVTGASHRIGLGIATALASNGFDIIVHYRSSEERAKDAAELLEKNGANAYIHRADLSDLTQIRHLVERIQSEFGRLDVLVNSAASFVKKSILETEPEDFEQSMLVNLKAPFFLTKYCYPLLKARKGVIINIADLSGTHAWTGFAAHGISKAGVLHLTRIAAREFAPDVRVNCIAPGPILPPQGMEEDDPIWQEMIRKIPLKNAGGVQVIGDAVLFLVSNKFMTGAVIPVDGGESLIGPANH